MAKGFSPESAQDLPPELSRWLHLFYAYLRVEQAYADALEWLGRTGAPYSFVMMLWPASREVEHSSGQPCKICFTVTGHPRQGCCMQSSLPLQKSLTC